ncbi:MAG: hypothetical protein ACRETL_06490, partial [Gammaproteobacteria bacterium]
MRANKPRTELRGFFVAQLYSPAPANCDLAILRGTVIVQSRSRNDRALTRRKDMGWIIAIIVGGIAGWLASKVMNR